MAAVVLVVYDGGRARFAESTVGSSWLSGPLRCRWWVSLPPARVIASARKNCEILRRFDETAAVFVARYWNAKPRLHGYLGNIPPEDYERDYYAQRHDASTGDAAAKTAVREPGPFKETLRTVLGTVDFELVRPGESGVTMKGRHTVAGELVLHALRYSICEASFMAHQRGRIDRRPVVDDALPRIKRAASIHSRAVRQCPRREAR